MIKFLPDDINIEEYIDVVGCGECENVGYNGRTAMYEILEVDDNIKQALPQRRAFASAHQPNGKVWNFAPWCWAPQITMNASALQKNFSTTALLIGDFTR